MTPATLEDLTRLLDLLQTKSVRAYSSGAFSLELAQAPEPSRATDLGPAVEKCPCSHSMAEHMNGACIICGGAEKCASTGPQ